MHYKWDGIPLLICAMYKHKNSNKQGDAGMGVAIGWLAGQGYCVSVPLTDSQEYDLVVEIDNELKKVQVKTTTQITPQGIFTVELRVSGGNKSGTGKVKYFSKEEVDYLFVLTDDNVMYFIPSSAITGTRSINLGNKYREYQVGWHIQKKVFDTITVVEDAVVSD